MDNTMFSIVVPVYNTKIDYLKQAVDSCLLQTYRYFEIILVDDGSKKEYAIAMDEMQKIDDRIKVIHKKNMGVSVARNVGIDHALGEYVLFMDSDDFLETNALEIIEKYISNNSLVDVLVFSLTRDYQDKIVPITPLYKNGSLFDSEKLNQKLQTDVLKAPLDKNILVFPYCKCIKRELLVEMQPCFPKKLVMCEDVVFALKLFGHTHSVMYIDNNLYHYRQLWDSAVNKYRENADKEQILLLRCIRNVIATSDNPSLIEGFYYEVFYSMQRIIMMKFFHANASGGFLRRRIECGKIFSKEPYRSALKHIRLKGMSRNQKIKACMIKFHLYACLGLLRSIYFKMPGRKQI